MSRKALGKGLSALFPQVAATADLIELSIDEIQPADAQPRRTFNEARLQELAASIQSNGVLQPIIVRRHQGRFQLIAGERRWRAAKQAGLQLVPCIIKEVADDKVLELSLIENIQREELNPVEEASAYKKLIESMGLTQEEIARRVGKDRSSIANSLRLLKLPVEIQKMIEDASISMGHARALLSLESPDRQRELAHQIARGGLSVRDTERLVKRSATSKRESSDPPLKAETANILAAESKLSRRLGAPVKIKLGRIGGAIEIRFSSGDDLTRLFDLLIKQTD